MAAKIYPECFPQPKDTKALVWRYMDFAEFFSLIATQKLFLRRTDKLGDPFEGSYPKANIKNRSKPYQGISKEYESTIKEMERGHSDAAKYWRRMIYVNCWHMNDYESAAMWNIYTKCNEAIAIQTTYENLFNALPETVFIGCVNYIDYEKESFLEGSDFYRFMHKRKSFDYENEVRIMCNRPLISKNGEVSLDAKNDKDGILISCVDLASLIEKIYVAPTASVWFRDLVEEVLKKYGIDKQVCRSNLDKDPVF